MGRPPLYPDIQGREAPGSVAAPGPAFYPVPAIWRLHLRRQGPGPQTSLGDGRAPEGFYAIAPHQLNPYSRYHLAFNVGYPNAYDRRYGRTGGHIMVHGRCVSIGCLAMQDGPVEEIYTLVDAALRHGQAFIRVHIFPFGMSDRNMACYHRHPWFGFWVNLKEGHDGFIHHQGIPPDVGVEDGRYRFKASDPVH